MERDVRADAAEPHAALDRVQADKTVVLLAAGRTRMFSVRFDLDLFKQAGRMNYIQPQPRNFRLTHRTPRRQFGVLRHARFGTLSEVPTSDPAGVQIATRDGQMLAGTYYPPIASSGVAVLINSATGVARAYYAPFAQHLAARGLAVLTYDYRGIGDSRSVSGTMEDWGQQDLPAALERLCELRPGNALTLVGHSLGGQILGLAHNIGRVRAAVLVASQSGYWRHWPWPRKMRMWLMWFVLVPGLSTMIGRFPGAWLGTANLPGSVALCWARWGRSPHYVCDARGNPLRPYNDHVTFPIHWLSFSDDPYAPFAAVEALRSYYSRADQERLHLTPADLGLPRIGHFGFFRKSTTSVHWDAIADWLVRHARPFAERRRAPNF